MDDCEIIYSQSNLEAVKSDYEKQLAFLKKQLEEAKAYCSKKDITISELQMQVEKMNVTLEDKNEEIAFLSKKQKEKQDQQKSSKEQVEKDLNTALLELSTLQDRNLSLSQENKKFIELVAVQKKEIERSFETIKKLNNELNALKAECKKHVIPIPVTIMKVNKNKQEEILFEIKKNLNDLHVATKRLYEDLESRIEVIKASEVDKKSESLKKAYEGDLVEIMQKMKEIMFFKDIAEGALF